MAAPQPAEVPVPEADRDAKLDELDRILNDPAVPMESARVWSLLAEIAEQPVAPQAK